MANLGHSARDRATGIEPGLEAAALVRIADSKAREIRFFGERDQARAATSA